ncbi:MAG: glycosyltransferase family 2 protein [Betaproteobacteria bacterium]|nr:glycosyltransferase family 2 protein [Betaproteobacteria bacterium]
MNPDITVIVPYHNEKENIEFTLERVGEQTLPATAAIFVNSSSTDDTFDVADNWIRNNQHRYATRFFNIFENTDNPASSKNAGIRRAGTEWVAFMDCGQNFERNWLEKQFHFSQANDVDVVSGVVYLIGKNWVDRCAIAQTYGYKRYRPCFPTTLARKTIFEKAGLLLEGRRAGYDVAWMIKLKKLGIKRGINEDVRIRYIGFNFSSSLAQLYKKSVLYAKPSVAIEGYSTPYFYVISPLLFMGILAISVKAALAVFLFYFLTRTFFLPILKSRSIDFYKEHPLEAVLGLGVVGLIIDLGKSIGTWQGIHYYFLKSRPAGR